MANLARDAVAQFYPDTVSVSINGTVVPHGGAVVLPVGARSAELAAVVVSKGSVHGTPGDSGPHTFAWSLSVFNGCLHAAYLSPDSPTTRLAVLDAGDSGQITVTVTGRFETSIHTIDFTVPGTP